MSTQPVSARFNLIGCLLLVILALPAGAYPVCARQKPSALQGDRPSQGEVRRKVLLSNARLSLPDGAEPAKPGACRCLSDEATGNDQAMALFLRAQTAVNAHRYDDALTEMKEALEINPKPSCFHSMLGRALAGLGRSEEALIETREAVRLDADDYALLDLFNLLKDLGRMKDAVQELKISKKNRKVTGMYIAALYYLKEIGALKKGGALADMAIQSVDKTNSSASAFGAAHTFKGDILALQGRRKEAKDHWKKVLANPLKDDYWTEQAKIRLPGEAAAAGNSTVSLHKEDNVTLPGTALEHWLRSRDLLKVRDYQGYIRELREAIRLDPDRGAYHSELSSILQQTGQKEEALLQMREAARVAEEDMYCTQLYDALKDLGKLDEAIAEAKKGIAKPVHRDVRLYVVLGRYDLDQGAAEQAMTMANTGFEIQKGEYKNEIFDPDLYLLKGDVLLQQNKKTEAREAWQKAADYSNKDLPAVKDAKKRLEDNP